MMPDKMNQVEIREMLKRRSEEFELWCDICTNMAREYYVYFEKLQEAGFTQQQALDILKARGTKV